MAINCEFCGTEMNKADVKVIKAACWSCLEERSNQNDIEDAMENYLDYLPPKIRRRLKDLGLDDDHPDLL